MNIKNLISVATAILILTLAGCSDREKPRKKMLIPEDKLITILTDTYLTGGMINLLPMRETWAQRDSILNYIDVIQSYGYTYEQFDVTLRYYFAEKPKKLTRIYDKVTGNLLKLEASVITTKSPDNASKEDNLWKGQTSYRLPEDFAKDPIWFDIPAKTPGEYVLHADIQVFSDDKSRNPRVTVYFSYIDDSGQEKRDYWTDARLKKDGQFHKIIISHTLDTVPDARIRGWLLNHDNQSGIWEKHARITNISLKLQSDEADK